MPEEEQLCDSCSKDCEELYAREIFKFSHAVDFVCKDCYDKVYDCNWEDDFGKVQITGRN